MSDLEQDGAGRPSSRPGPDRRQVLASGAAGIISLALPAAAVAASGDEIPPDGADAGLNDPVGVTAVPIGYASGGSTGAIRVSWSAVTGATGYEVGWATTSEGSGPYTFEPAGDVLTHVLSGRVGTDTIHHVVVRATAGLTASLNSSEVTSSSVIATGGTVTTFTGDGADDGVLNNIDGATYVVHTFGAGGTFTLNRSIDVEHLMVGGGGGGGSRHGGGGGGGGLRTDVAQRGADGTSTTFPVTVGAGGLGATAHGNTGPFPAATAGGSSSVFGLTVPGGGTGGGTADGAGGAGGSGGGAANASSAVGTASGAPVFGNAGGAGTGNPAGQASSGGGGGGAGTAGQGGQASAPIKAGDGGSGRASVISSNSSALYAGGGGGSTNAGAGGSGGSGGGGAGATGGAAGTDGTGNRGGGGGGGGFNDSLATNNFAGGSGGSGVVILRYVLPS